MARILMLDAGNSGVKWRLEGVAPAPFEAGRCRLSDPPALDTLAALARCADEVWLASVLSDDDEARLLRALSTADGGRVRRAVSEAFCAGVRNSYQDPTRMGVDRWLALIAVRQRCRERACVVDAGTALTIDLIAADGAHEGGYILPGRALLETSLLTGTGRVRDAQPGRWSLAPGRSTAEAVTGGASLALAGAVREALERAGAPAPRVFFSGGDGPALLEAAGCEGDLVPDLVFEGLRVAMTAA
jgi:type III pantothenate kinase